MKSQGKLCPWTDTKSMCNQLLTSPFFDDIELVIKPPKFLALKFPTYKRTNDHVAYVIHFKITMIIISIPENKKEAMFYQLFTATTFQETMQQ